MAWASNPSHLSFKRKLWNRINETSAMNRLETMIKYYIWSLCGLIRLGIIKGQMHLHCLQNQFLLNADIKF